MSEFNWDDLSPDDFATPVATSGTLLPRDADQSFDEFVDQHLEALRRTYDAAAEGPMLAYLAVGDRKWVFAPTTTETIDDFVERVHVEAHMLGARMLFVNRQRVGGVIDVAPEELLGSHDPANFARLQAAGLARQVMFYFAEHNHGGGSQYRQGVMYITNGKLGEPVEAFSEGIVGNPYAQILKS